jgi:putative ABC transport system substrate-binding protein
LLHEFVPAATTFALLVDPTNIVTGENLSSDAQAAARTLGLQLHILRANTEDDMAKAFAALVPLQAGGLVIASAFFAARSEQLAALALRHAVPAIFEFREFAAAGGLMSYGSTLS